ncbi:type II secretion system minor pseudopilin GspJ [Vibrio sagamiensis]|uniref:Type II secretion system protein J n=1 Tax=Vibrio sagamiensis NBRC 104589 TaxID=1219064 RepID=A0A511QEZ2_9VIBR|nr:type II secretion system minor pseudopilin GspJ [Vibrio sagamiensis]PNQ71280.1 type II secretion system protein GspJ [Vibrio agarivorans]GEM75864.1 type II secretion system protein GspJ [Vibrio sagamiensis NBRC 104589]
MLSSKPQLSRSTQGFTLIEVLVSIAIFATMSMAAYQVVSQVQQSNQVSLEKTQRLNELQRALVMMDNDFRQMATRTTRTNGEKPAEKLLFWSDNLLNSDAKGIMFTRTGWHNPQQQFPRGEVTKVGYRLKGESLQRIWWRYPDTPVGQTPVVTPLLSQVDEWDMRFYDGNSWKETWDEKGTLPSAIKMVLKLQDYGEISRTYLTSGGKLVASEKPGRNDDDGFDRGDAPRNDNSRKNDFQTDDSMNDDVTGGFDG